MYLSGFIKLVEDGRMLPDIEQMESACRCDLADTLLDDRIHDFQVHEPRVLAIVRFLFGAGGDDANQNESEQSCATPENEAEFVNAHGHEKKSGEQNKKYKPEWRAFRKLRKAHGEKVGGAERSRAYVEDQTLALHAEIQPFGGKHPAFRERDTRHLETGYLPLLQVLLNDGVEIPGGGTEILHQRVPVGENVGLFRFSEAKHCFLNNRPL